MLFSSSMSHQLQEDGRNTSCWIYWWNNQFQLINVRVIERGSWVIDCRVSCQLSIVENATRDHEVFKLDGLHRIKIHIMISLFWMARYYSTNVVDQIFYDFGNRHQACYLTNIHSSFMKLCNIHLRATFLEMCMILTFSLTTYLHISRDNDLA